MAATELTPAQKAERTRLINEGIRLKVTKEEAEAQLKEVQDRLYKQFAEAEIEASGRKSCVFSTNKGACEVGLSTTITIPDELLANLRAALGERFEELVEVKQTHALTSSLKRIIETPNPQEAALAERIRPCLRFRQSPRFTFKPAA